MPSLTHFENCGPCEIKKPLDTLTQTLEQTEKQIYGIQELVGAIESKLSGPIPRDCETGPNCQSIQEYAEHNQAVLSEIAVRLSRIAERL